jgi:hypothetical protein
MYGRLTATIPPTELLKGFEVMNLMMYITKFYIDFMSISVIIQSPHTSDKPHIGQNLIQKQILEKGLLFNDIC